MEDPTAEQKAIWEREQLLLKSRLITTDSFDWSADKSADNCLQYVGGVDISFVPGSPDQACACLVVLAYASLKVVYVQRRMVTLTQPYISGFLGFREVPFLAELIDELRENAPHHVPGVILVDGNGILHHRGFGSASHLGVVCDIPTIGIGKKLLAIDGLDEREMRARVLAECHGADSLPLVGLSGTVHGAALRSTSKSQRPVYISIGHRISLETAVQVTQACCLFKEPEPVRKADLLSREFIRDYLAQANRGAR